ncbi:GrpB family protein [Vibrio nigripulchritudo]|uniref:GrpB family protein n=1 Tax=Vibrio nigripulchritudo TaxID=28173 RepID=UPI0003B1F78B|nr:GrpB family protein [Vibrio nigripulchritudo]CCN69743.1 hypothetical protein VIBNISFn118_1490003 [Vibrio nigripulchritudo SFn118]
MDYNRFKKLSRPIIISPYSKSWNEFFSSESKRISTALKNFSFILEHFGSTAIPDMSSKPTVDIALGYSDERDIFQIIANLESIGYIYEKEISISMGDRYLLWLGTKDNHQFHIHMVSMSSNTLRDFVIFREYLKENQEVALEYKNEKIKLAKKYVDDISLYVKDKNKIHKKILNKARNEYTNYRFQWD